jgi:5-methylcytosine-specific restriction endonuclease McrA
MAHLFPLPKPKAKAKRKATIPKALREQVWLKTMKKTFEGKCPVVWCTNTINAFDFQCGHNVPESKGGKTTLDNLIPLCGRCNISMGDRYTIDEWNAKFRATPKKTWRRFWCFTPILQSDPTPPVSSGNTK